MSDAEKQRAIEAIDAETKERIAALTRLQVAEESGLASFEAVNNKLDKEAQGAMKDLEDLLKQNMVAFSQHTAAERLQLRDQTSRVSSLVQSIMSMITDEQESIKGKTTEEQEQQRLELEKTLLSMKATAQESSVHGKEALALAKAAEGKASTAMR